MSENVVIPFTSRSPARARRSRRPAVPAGTPLAALLDPWLLALEVQNKSPVTIRLYSRTARMLVEYLTQAGLPCDAESVQAEHVRAFLAAEQARTSVHTSAAHHRYLSVWFNWMIADGERTTFSPVLKADKPTVPKKAKRYLTEEELAALLHACRGTAFADRRDTAIIRILVDNGARVGGLSSLLVEGVDLRGRRLHIILKGGDEHWAPVGAKTAQAIDRYLRVRARHPLADAPQLWLGGGTPGLTQSGIFRMLARRGDQAGVEGVHPHRFRGTAAHLLLAAGADGEDVRRILGWRSADMLRHYTEELGDERARATHSRLSPSDRL